MKMWEYSKGATGYVFIVDLEEYEPGQGIRHTAAKRGHGSDDTVLDWTHIHNARHNKQDSVYVPGVGPRPFNDPIVRKIEETKGAAFLGAGKRSDRKYVIVFPQGEYNLIA